MMSRLIDDMSLKDRVSEYTLSPDEYERFCRIIDAEPMAYNVDNVLAQLEKNSYFDDYVAEKTKVIDRDRAIEIVKQGGKS